MTMLKVGLNSDGQVSSMISFPAANISSRTSSSSVDAIELEVIEYVRAAERPLGHSPASMSPESRKSWFA